MKQMSHLNDL